MRQLLIALGITLSLVGWSHSAEPQRPNVLLIMADDLRCELGCYGSPAKTPNIDRLAERGVLFSHAYCQQALCNPSRSSMLSGRRPDTLGLWCNSVHFRDLAPDVVTLPEWFKQHGYVTRDVGKIFHNFHTKVKGDPQSWSAPEFLHYASHADDKPVVDGEPPRDQATAPKCERRDVPDEAYYDGRVAAEAIRVLGEVKSQPFFLAVGFWKPHAPMNPPAKYWNIYDRAKLPGFEPNRPTGAPEIAFHNGSELRGQPPKQIDFSSAEAAELRHGYFAGTTFMDTQVGKVLAALDQLGLTDSTLIVFCADHGYHLGEHALWAKTSCFDLDAHVPLVIVPPKNQPLPQRGGQAAGMVELLDLYPTLAELCSLPAPKGLDGNSLAPVLKDTKLEVKPGAFTQHPRPAYYDRFEKGVPDAMGYSVRTGGVRYTEWRDWETGKLVGSELYDHESDPGETKNAVGDAGQQAALASARSVLHKQFPADIAPKSRAK